VPRNHTIYPSVSEIYGKHTELRLTWCHSALKLINLAGIMIFEEFETGRYTGFFSPGPIQGQPRFFGKRIDDFGFEFECYPNAGVASMSEYFDRLTSLTRWVCLDSVL
jgi:hypothetical protein